MATEIKVPTLGESVSEATVAQWLKKKGEAVAADEPLVELETDKVTLEVNAPASGVLSEIAVEEGANVEVGAVLGAIEEGASAAPAKEEKKAEAPKEEKKAEAPTAAPKEEKKAAATASNGSGKTVELPVPTLGESVSEATVASWLKKEGDSISADEPLVELETDKVTLEVNAPVAGKLSSIKAKEGETVEVGAVLALIAEGASGAATAPAAKEDAPAPKAQEAPKPTAAPTPTDPSPGSGLDAGKLAREDGKVTKEALLRFFEETTPPSAMTLSPAVATLIAEKGLDPNRIKGTGPEGRITKEDVLDLIEGKSQLLSAPKAPAPAAAPQPAAKVPTHPPAGSAVGSDVERVKMPKLRQTIARRLKEAQNTAAMLTTFNEVDMGAVMEARAQYKEAFEKKHGVKLGFMSFFVKAVVASLQELPAVNGRIDGEEIVYNKCYHMGVAVSTPNGLMVPVLRDADKLSFAEIEAGIADLGKRARDGKLSLDEMQGGTFTITNGGIFGSLLSTPILNTPQSGILGMHKIQERPMAVRGEVKIRPMMYLAHSYDHRLIDGREAVTFLVKVKEALEDPQRLLLGV
jgi:2-oxoglutarate dehydrogenase E2 component (dihydrolipoamide succinyltransferase)